MSKINMSDLFDVYFSLHQSVKRSSGKAAGAARALGCSESNIYARLDLGDETHIVRLNEFVMLMDYTANTEPLERLCEMFGGQFTTKSTETAETWMEAAMVAAKEGSDVNAVVLEIMADKVVEFDELQKARREVREQNHANTVMLNTLERLYREQQATPVSIKAVD